MQQSDNGAQDLITIRPAPQLEEGELNFIINSWLKSYKASKWSGPVAAHHFFPAYKATILDILDRPTTRVFSAHIGEDTAVWLGYIVAEFREDTYPCLHYCYVKRDFRKNGLGKRLVAHAVGSSPECTYSFRTARTRRLLGDRVGVYDPFAARYRSERKTS